MPWIPLDFMHYVLQSFFDFYNFVWAFCCTFKIVPTNSSQNKKSFLMVGPGLGLIQQKMGFLDQSRFHKEPWFFYYFYFLFYFYGNFTTWEDPMLKMLYEHLGKEVTQVYAKCSWKKILHKHLECILIILRQGRVIHGTDRSLSLLLGRQTPKWSLWDVVYV